MSFQNILRTNVQLGSEFIRDMIIKEWQDQGHSASGNAERQLSVDYIITDSEIKYIGTAEDYMVYMNYGVDADRWVIGWKKWKEKGIEWLRTINKSFKDESDRNSFLYFTWKKHKAEGMPTRSSVEFSENGRRTEWMKYTVDDTRKIEQLKKIINFEQIILAAYEPIGSIFSEKVQI